MANYPDVVPGQPVRFSAKRETAVNRLLNEADQFRAGVLRAKTSPMVRIPIWNSTQTAFKAGQVVQINVSGSMCGDAFPAVAFSSTDAVFGVCQSGLAANETGDMIISGPATVQIGGGTGSYAMPVSGGTFSRGTSGMKILHVVGTTATTGVIMMGDLNSGGGGGTYGVEAVIDGTTASVNLVPGGSVTSISVVPGTNVSISGGSNGELIFGANVPGGGGGDPSYVYMSTGAFLMNANSVNYLYCPQAYTSEGNRLNVYDFELEETRGDSIEAIEDAADVTISDTTRYTDDYGNTILILPKNPTHLTRVVVNVAPVSGYAVVVTPDSKRIVDSFGDPQGKGNGLSTDQIYGGVSYLYLFINSISGWPEYVYDDIMPGSDETNKTVIETCISQEGGCWMKIDLNS